MLLNKRKLLSDRKLLGRWGEKRCGKFLKRKGLKKLTQNFSCKAGEIDLIMVDPDGTIVFVEVKTRADENFAPAEYAITPAKKTRMSRAARYFLAANNIKDRALRFDVVTIVLNQIGRESTKSFLVSSESAIIFSAFSRYFKDLLTM